jgi:hypothetical protein
LATYVYTLSSFGAWTLTDFASLSGGLRIEGIIHPDTPVGCNVWDASQQTSMSWEDMGVPHGETVTQVVAVASCRFQDPLPDFTDLDSGGSPRASISGCNLWLMDPAFGYADHSAISDTLQQFNFGNFGDGSTFGSYDSGVVTRSATIAPFGGLASSYAFGMLLQSGFVEKNGFLVISQIEFTITTAGGGGGGNPAQTITPTSARIHPGQTVHFSTNNPANFGIVGATGNNTGNVDGTGGGSGRPADGSIPTPGLVWPDGGVDSNDPSTGVTYQAPAGVGTYTVTAVDATDDSNTATAEITVALATVDVNALSSGFSALLFSGLGAHKPLPASRLTSATWTDERYGGWTGFTVEIGISLGEAIPAAQGDIFEFYWKGERRYRGFVSDIIVEELDPPKLTIAGYGIAFQAGKPVLNHALVYASATDIARVFADICKEFVSPNFVGLVIDAQPVGASVQLIESTYQQVADVVQDLCENQAENLALWGGDADENGNNRVYIKPFSSEIDWGVLVPGPNTTAGKSESQAGDIVNRLTILGGNPRYPNLVYNSSFERPRFTGESEGNVLLDPDFEAGTDWSGSGSRITASSSEGSAYTGSHMWQTEASPKNGTQAQNPSAVAIVPGWDYVIGVNCRAETLLTTAAGLVTVVWKDSSGSTLQTDTLAVPAIGDPQGVTLQWQTFQTVVRAPAGATGYSFEVKTASGGATGAGLHWDACELAPASVIYQDKWEIDLLGSAAINRLNWAYRDGIDGGYCLLADLSASDSDANYGALQPLGSEHFEVQGGTTYVVSAYFKSPPGVTSNGKLRLEVQEFNAAGAETIVTHVNIAAGSGWTDWTQEFGSVTMDPATTHAMVRIIWRGDSAVLIDGICFRDSSAGHEFIRDGQFTIRLQATDTRMALSTAAQESTATYGVLEATETVESISSLADALVFGEAYFNLHAVPIILPTVDVVNDDRFFRPGQLVRLIGPDAGVIGHPQGEPLPIVKIDWSWDGLLHASLEMQKEQPDLASLIKGRSQKDDVGSSSFTSTSGGAAPPPSSTPSGSISATAPIVAAPDPITGAGTISHADSGVAPGTYSGVTITVDATGHITAIMASHLEPIILDGEIVLLDGDIVLLEGV